MSAAAVRQMPEPFTAAEVARYYKYRAPRLRRVGGEIRGPCPIHQGKRDWFAVNPETGEWFCHSSCGRGGSLISFEVELSGKPFAEAAADVRSIVGRPEAPAGVTSSPSMITSTRMAGASSSAFATPRKTSIKGAGMGVAAGSTICMASGESSSNFRAW